MKLRTIIAATAMVAAIGTQAQPQYLVLNNPQVDMSKCKMDKEGFYVLFDGTSMDGWRGYCKDHIPSKWNIKDGALHFDGRTTKGEGGDIIFAHKFKNFEFELEWKISEGGNSGIFYLGQETATIRKDAPKTEEFASPDGKIKVTQTIEPAERLNYEPIYISCPECQVLDNERHPDAKLGATLGIRQSTSLYDMIVAKPQNAKPAGEWNKVKIVVKNNKVTHYQNGVKVLSYKLADQSWIDLIQTSKFSQKNWPLAYEIMKDCGKEAGYFGMQDHGDEVWYRNIRVKVLK